MKTERQSRWFCLRSQPKREHVAAANLAQRVKLDVFAPRIRTRRSTRRGEVVASTEALFPGYLFARFNYQDEWRYVMSTQGVTGIVCFGQSTPAIADEVIAYLRMQLDDHAQNQQYAPVFAAGAWVRVVTGCFRGSEGRVLESDPQSTRVRVLLSLLGREVQISLPVHHLLTSEPRSVGYPPGLLAGNSTTGVSPDAR